MIEDINALGDKVERRWKDAGYKVDAFPRIAGESLAQRRLHERLSPQAVIDWSLEAQRAPKQLSLGSKFGDPPLTLYAGEKFVIDAYFWLDPKTDIHNHDFSGAFTVIRGISFHSEYRFDVAEDYRQLLLLGRLTATRSEILRAGEIREIRSGSEFIHRVWHITRPSLSLVVRTRKDIDHQYFYAEPNVAVNFRALTHRSQDALSVKKQGLLQYLHRVGDPGFESYARRLIEDSDAFGAYDHVSCYARLVNDEERIAGLYQTARAKHGAMFGPLHDAFKAGQMLNNVRWSALHAEGPRLLLSLMFSLRDRASILEFIRQVYPDRRPDVLVVEWLREISAQEALYFQLPEISMRVIQALLTGRSADEVVSELGSSFQKDGVSVESGQLEKLTIGLRDHEFLKPLFLSGERR